MKQPIVVIGIGEMAGVFTRGFLKQGYPVFPVTRDMNINDVARALAEPAVVLVAVGENDLHPTLEKMPATWRGHLALLQNELLPRDWQHHGIENPTVISVWFEKKKGQDYKVLVPSPVYGPRAALIEAALGSLDIPTWELKNGSELLFELVRKNIYILTTNIAGLVMEPGSNVDDLWYGNEGLAREVANDVMDIQAWLTGAEPERDRLIEGMVEAIQGDLKHKCMGRSAPGRLARALTFADEAGLEIAKLREISRQTG